MATKSDVEHDLRKREAAAPVPEEENTATVETAEPKKESVEEKVVEEKVEEKVEENFVYIHPG